MVANVLKYESVNLIILYCCTYSRLLGTVGLSFGTPWDWWGMQGLVLRLMDDWNEVWSTLEEGGKSADVGWYVTMDVFIIFKK